MPTYRPLVNHSDETTEPGIYWPLENENQDYPLEIPPNALSMSIWFEDADGNHVKGQVGLDQSNTAVTVTNTSLGWQDAMPYYMEFLGYTQSGQTYRYSDTWVHLSSPVAGTIVYGQWGFVTDASPSE